MKLLVPSTCVALVLLSACTTVNVQKVDATKYPISLVCIEENPDVLVGDLIRVLESGFHRHNIKTLIYRNQAPDQCEYKLWYTAFREWDMAPFVSDVDLRLHREAETVASATYSHSGGLALNKWASTEAKLNPVIDQLLEGFGSVSPK